MVGYDSESRDQEGCPPCSTTLKFVNAHYESYYLSTYKDSTHSNCIELVTRQ